MNPRHPRMALATALVAAGLSLAACTSLSAPAAQPTPATGNRGTAAAVGIPAATTGGDPCSLLTQSDVDTAVGQPLGKAKADAALGTCQWATSDFAAGVIITTGDWVSIKGAATAGSHQPTSVSGVGDEALNLNDANGSLLYVRKGSKGVLITLNGPNVDALPDHGLAKEEVLAAALLGRY